MSADLNELRTSPRHIRNSDRAAVARAQVPACLDPRFSALFQPLTNETPPPPGSKGPNRRDTSNRHNEIEDSDKLRPREEGEVTQIGSDEYLVQMFNTEDNLQGGGDDRGLRANAEPGRTSHGENPEPSPLPGATDIQDENRSSGDLKTRLEPEQASKSRNPKRLSKEHSSHDEKVLQRQNSAGLVNVHDAPQMSRDGSLRHPHRHQDERHGNDSSHREGSQHSETQRHSRKSGGTHGKRPDTKSDNRSRKSPTRSTSDAGGVRLDDNSSEIKAGAESHPRNKPKSSKMPIKSQRPLEVLGRKNKELENQNQKLVSTISEQDNQILELKEMISRLHQRDGEPPKADNYFATGFTDIACSIEQWVLQHFPRGPNDPGASTISPALREMFSMATIQLEKHLNTDRVRVMSAVFAQLLWNEISSLSHDFRNCNMPGAPSTTEALQAIATKLQGNFYQRQRWRAMTMCLVAKGNNFETGLVEYVDRAAEKIGGLLSTLAPLESDSIPRKNGLRDIIEKAVKLAIEIHKEPDLIFLHQVLPGRPFSSESMEDMSCQYPENELEMRKASVQIQVFPSVLRLPYDWDESPSTLPAVVMKAKTISELPLSGEALLK